MYSEFILENAHPVVIEQILEDSVYNACMAGGEELVEAFMTYADILESDDYEPQVQFEEALSEALYPYFESASAIYESILFEDSTDDYNNRIKSMEDVIAKAKASGNHSKAARWEKSLNKVKSNWNKSQSGGNKQIGNNIKQITNQSGGSSNAQPKSREANQGGTVKRFVASKEQMDKFDNDTEENKDASGKVQKQHDPRNFLQKMRQSKIGRKVFDNKAAKAIGRGASKAKEKIMSGASTLNDKRKAIAASIKTKRENLAKSVVHSGEGGIKGRVKRMLAGKKAIKKHTYNTSSQRNPTQGRNQMINRVGNH